MALFKISRGNSANLPSTMNDGWAYFCTDSAGFFIDYTDANGDLHRKQLSAEFAEKLRYVKDGDTIEINPSELATRTYVDNKIASIPTPDVSAQISNHNTSSTAHADIRDEIVASKSVVMANIDAASTEFSSSWLNGIIPEEDKLYVVKNDNMLYRWNGESYVRVNIGVPTKQIYKFTANTETDTFIIPSSMYNPDTCTLELIQENVVLIEGENYTASENVINLIDYYLLSGESIYCVINAIGYGVNSLMDAPALDNKANKTVISAMNIYATGWSNKTYSFEGTYPFSTYDISIELNGDSCTAEQMNAWSDAKILGSATSNKIKAMGTVPTINIPVIVRAVQK